MRRTWARAALGFCSLFAAACSSDPSGSTGGTGGSGGGGSGGTGGTGGTGSQTSTNTCGTAKPTLLYASKTILNGLALDDSSLYFVESLDVVSRLPKAGGAPTTIGEGRVSIWLPRLYFDAGSLYFTNNSDVFKLDVATGARVSLATSTAKYKSGIGSGLALDKDFIYFGDDIHGDAGEPQGTVNRVPKAGGAVSTLATGQAGPGSLAVDDSHAYWVNNGTLSASFESLNNGGIGRVPLAGGAAQSLFTVQADGKGIEPMLDIVLTGNDIYFTSANLDDLSNAGAYRLPKNGGAPSPFSDYSTLSGFVLNGALYADNGDRISKFDLASGEKTDIVCFPDALEGSAVMAHDATRIYYIKMEPKTEDGESPDSVYSIPLE
jgi:hypothetical protein